MNDSKIDQLLNGFNLQAQEDDDPMISKGFYLTPKLDKALAMKAANDGLKKSEVVQDALRAYLAPFLQKK